jgi:hypothetical protein
LNQLNEAKAQPASVSGQAGRISRADKEAAALAACPAQLHMTIEITRAGTGKKEVFELVGTPIPTEPKEET